MHGKFRYCDAPNMGFHMEFDNGYKISVQWSKGNSCSNRFKEFPDNESKTAEIQVTDSGGKEQEPIGWVTVREVADKIHEVSTISTGAKHIFDFI